MGGPPFDERCCTLRNRTSDLIKLPAPPSPKPVSLLLEQDIATVHLFCNALSTPLYAISIFARRLSRLANDQIPLSL